MLYNQLNDKYKLKGGDKMKKVIITLGLAIILALGTTFVQDPKPPIGAGDINVDDSNITTQLDPKPPIG